MRVAFIILAMGLALAAALQPRSLRDMPIAAQIANRDACSDDPADLPAPNRTPDGRESNYLHTCRNQVLDAKGREVRMVGVNWSGLEGGNYAPQGLDSRNWLDILDQVAELGYNTIRVPFSSEALEPQRRVGGVNFNLNPGLEGLSALEMIDRLIVAARDRGLKVILDRHFTTAGRIGNLWYTKEVPEERWIADWRMLAERYKGNDTVVAVDLHNEPHGEATWGDNNPATDWRLAAERAGNAVLEANPYLLVFVEGIENYGTDHWWWGGNLLGASSAPIRLRVPNRLVYSPHDYGPAIDAQAWFSAANFPDNMPNEWDRHWGYIARQGIAPVVVGEFGGRSVGEDADGQWQRALLDYLRTNRLGALVWSLNPNWDTGGIVTDDWRRVDEAKQQAYRHLGSLPLDNGPLGVFGVAPPRYRQLLQQLETSQTTETIAFSGQIVNDSRAEIDLNRFELRYWIRLGDKPAQDRRIQVEGVELPAEHAQVDLVRHDQGGQDHYLRVRFDGKAGTVAKYSGSGKVIVRFHATDSPGHRQSEDYSFTPRFQQYPGDSEQVTLYLDGNLVFGKEP